MSALTGWQTAPGERCVFKWRVKPPQATTQRAEAQPKVSRGQRAEQGTNAAGVQGSSPTEASKTLDYTTLNLDSVRPADHKSIIVCMFLVTTN